MVKLYNVSDGAFLQTLEDSYLSTLQFQAGYEVPMYFADVKQLQFAPDGQSLAGWMIVRQCSNCVTTGTVLVLWRVSDGTIFEVVDEFYSDAALWLTSAPDGQSLVVATSDSVRFLRPSDSVVLHTLAGYAPAVDGIAFSPDGKFLASNSGQPYLTARLWQVADGQLVKRFADSLNPGSGPSNVAFSPDGQILWVQGSFWQVADGERLVRLEQKIGAVAPPYWASSLAFAPYGNTLAIGYLEGHLLLWDLAEEALLVKLEGYSGEVASLAFSPDGRTLASVYSYPNYAVQLWQVPEGERVLAIQGAVFSRVAFSPDGQILATLAQVEEGMDRGVAQLWRVSDGEQLIQLAANGVLSMAFSPDGQTLATGLYDHTVRLWHVADGALLNVLAGHSDYVTDLAFSPDGELLASGSNDGSVILWGIPAP